MQIFQVFKVYIKLTKRAQEAKKQNKSYVLSPKFPITECLNSTISKQYTQNTNFSNHRNER